MKTRTAWLTFAKKEKVTCTSTGEKDDFRKEIWRDQEGKAYQLCYEKFRGVWVFLRYNAYDK